MTKDTQDWERANKLARNLNDYKGEDFWNDLIVGAYWKPFIDIEATEEADPRYEGLIVILDNGWAVVYNEAAREWQVQLAPPREDYHDE